VLQVTLPVTMPPTMTGKPKPLSPPQMGFGMPLNSHVIGGRNKVFMVGDVKSMNTKGFGEGLNIWKRLGVLVRMNLGLEVFEVMKGFDKYDRSFMERTQFYRALENLIGKPWIELAMTTEEFDELCRPYITKTSGPGGPPPMIQYRRFALDLQKYADKFLTDDDITKAQELRGYVNPGDLVRNDGFFHARADEKGQDMSPDKRRLKKHQSPEALASGLWEYEDIIDEDGDGRPDDDFDTGDDRAAGEASAAQRLGWGAGAAMHQKAEAEEFAFAMSAQAYDSENSTWGLMQDTSLEGH